MEEHGVALEVISFSDTFSHFPFDERASTSKKCSKASYAESDGAEALTLAANNPEDYRVVSQPAKNNSFSMYITEDFDAAAEVQRLNEIRRARRKQSVTRRSRLDRHGFELIRLYQEGATFSALAIYLRERRIVVHETTISRWIKKRIA